MSETRSNGAYVSRRRRCTNTSCGKRTTTVEIVVRTTEGEKRLHNLGEVIALARTDVENFIRVIASALALRDGAKAVEDLIRTVLPEQPQPTGQDHGPGRRQDDSGTD